MDPSFEIKRGRYLLCQSCKHNVDDNCTRFTDISGYGMAVETMVLQTSSRVWQGDECFAYQRRKDGIVRLFLRGLGL